MAKVQLAYEKSIDYLLSQAFKFWYWLGCKLEVTITVPPASPETQETLARLVAENDELKAGIEHQLSENRKLLDKISRMEDTWGEAVVAKPKTGPQRPNNNRKLTESEVQEIRDRHRAGEKNVDLAYSFDVNPATISRIVRGQYHKKLAVA